MGKFKKSVRRIKIWVKLKSYRIEVKRQLKILWFSLKKLKLSYNNFIDISVKATVQIFHDVGLLIDLKTKVKSLRALFISKTDEKWFRHSWILTAQSSTEFVFDFFFPKSSNMKRTNKKKYWTKKEWTGR